MRSTTLRVALRTLIVAALAASGVWLSNGRAGAKPTVPADTRPLPGSATCLVSVTVHFSPPLSDHRRAKTATISGSLEKCASSDRSVVMKTASLSGSFSGPPVTCAGRSTGAALDLTIRWRRAMTQGLNHAQIPAADSDLHYSSTTIAPGIGGLSEIVGPGGSAPGVSSGSYAGDSRVRFTVSRGLHALEHRCAKAKGISKLSLGGRIRIGDSSSFYNVHLRSVSGIAAGRDAAVWFTDPVADTVGRISTTSRVMARYPVLGAIEPKAITVGPDRALWFTNQGQGSIGRITTSGRVTMFAVRSIHDARGLAAGPDGAMWFTDGKDDAVGRITTGGAVTIYTSPAIHDPQGITSGPDGALWFTNRTGPSIGRITTDGTVTAFTDPGLMSPLAITTGPDGALWFTDPGRGSVDRITTTGVVSVFANPSIEGPAGITSGPDGALWFTDYENDSIGRITTSGTLGFYTDAWIDFPLSIASGPDGALWFTNVNHTINRLAPSVASRMGTGVTGMDGFYVLTGVVAP